MRSPVVDQSLHRSECAGFHGTGRVRTPTEFRTPGVGNHCNAA